MDKKPTVPTQFEVNSLAAFIEAATELENEPFFSPDDQLKLVSHGGDKIIAVLGDRFHFRSALVSFRRIWLEKEASYFYDVLKLIRKYEGDLFIDWLRREHQRIEKSPYCSGAGLTAKQLVDLWLNAVFAHHNIRQKTKKSHWHDRVDFDRYAAKSSYAIFEFDFRKAVRDFGCCYRNALKLVARPAFNRWGKELGLKPEFKIGAPFGSGIEETTTEGDVIIRRPSTEFSGQETLEQKLIRLLARYEFSPLAAIFRSLQIPPQQLVTEILRSASYEDLLQRAGLKIQLEAESNLEKLHVSIMPGCEGNGIIAELPHLETSTGKTFYTAIHEERRVLTHQPAIEFFNKKLQRLKSLF